ncbi:hypothetical protein [Nonomuraea sp. NPDC049129]|uniref:hypothetical protein n=1 Tax=Nonomuraea sp. NPDC049129 TaxID=3155272 RepID=UPI00340B6569
MGSIRDEDRSFSAGSDATEFPVQQEPKGESHAKKLATRHSGARGSRIVPGQFSHSGLGDVENRVDPARALHHDAAPGEDELVLGRCGRDHRRQPRRLRVALRVLQPGQGLSGYRSLPNDAGNPYRVQHALERRGFYWPGEVIETSISWTALKGQIDVERPFYAGVSWAAGGGHALVVYGYDTASWCRARRLADVQRRDPSDDLLAVFDFLQHVVSPAVITREDPAQAARKSRQDGANLIRVLEAQ